MTDRLVLEVGAGDGSSAWEFAKMPGVIVQAFEPSTTMRGIAYERLRGLNNVTVFPYAVGGTDRQAELYRCNGSAASLHEIGEPHERCTVVSMNHLFVTFRIAEIDTLFLDCNGSEYEILEQMLDCDRMRQARELRIVWNGDEPERKAALCAAIARTHEPPDRGANWERKDVMGWPKVWILFGTYKRTAASLATIESLQRYLKYPNCHFHICDDGSGETDDGTGRDHVDVLKARFAEFYPEVTAHVMNTPPGKFNTGGNINVGIKLARDNGCDIHMLVFDDWALLRELDICPMVDILDSNPAVGFVRLSYRVPGNNGCVVDYTCPRCGGGYMWYRLIREWSLHNPYGPSDSYMISIQPYVAHWRFFEAYGFLPEHVAPGTTEIELGRQYNESPLGENGPQVLFPIGPGVVHAPWGHMVGRANYYLEQFGA